MIQRDIAPARPAGNPDSRQSQFRHSDPQPPTAPRRVRQKVVMPPFRLLTQCDHIANALIAARGAWVTMPDLVNASGSYNIHSRIDELRHTRALTIECKVDRRPGSSRKYSAYRIPVQESTKH